MSLASTASQHPAAAALQQTLTRWQYFAPCLGTNLSLIDAASGSWQGASGWQAFEPEQTMPVDVPCYIYSITKVFTAVRVLQLAEQAQLMLDQAMASYLPDLDLPETVTVRHLLAHTSGVPSYTDLAAYAPATQASPSHPWSPAETLERCLPQGLDFEPGSRFHYSNTGYLLLLLLIESLSGQSYAQNIAEMLAALRLTQTYAAETVASGQVTAGFGRCLDVQQQIQNITPIYHPLWCQTGLIVATSSEVCLFYQALFGGQLLSPASLAQMMAHRSIGEAAGPHFTDPGYGLGLMTDPATPYGASFAHGGSGPGFNSWAVYYPDFKGRALILSILCNTSMGGHPFALVNDILQVLAAV